MGRIRSGAWLGTAGSAANGHVAHGTVPDGGRFLEHPFAIRNQGQVPCCVSIALVTAMEIRGVALKEATPSAAVYRLSAIYHYSNSRGSLRVDGSLPSITMEKALAQARSGIVSFKECPCPDGRAFTAEDILSPRARPARRAVASLIYDPNRRTEGYHAIDRQSRRDWIEVLQQNCPILVGAYLPDQYWERVRRGEAETVDSKARPPWDRDGHAFVIRGFETRGAETRFRVRDSFGRDCGKDGEWWFPDQCLGAMVYQAWCITNVAFT